MPKEIKVVLRADTSRFMKGADLAELHLLQIHHGRRRFLLPRYWHLVLRTL